MQFKTGKKRNVLQLSFLIAVILMFLCGETVSAQNKIQRVGGPYVKTSLNAYSFSKALNDHTRGRGEGMTLFQLSQHNP